MLRFGSVIIILNSLLLGFLLLTYIFCYTKIIHHNSDNYYKHRVILVVLDAFRHDYLEIAQSRNYELTNLKIMMNQGSRIMKMVPAYPTVTMSNHQTLVTGLYTPYHGITDNTFNDSSLNYDRFAMGNQSSLNEARWYKGYPDPIWVSCEKANHCKSGSMLWPNTDSPINGYRPSRKVDQYITLNEKKSIIYPYDRRVDEMLNWITKDLIDFGLLYFDEPDVTSHKYGPTHELTLKKIVEMDGWIGRLLTGIKTAGLSDSIDVIVTSDHGMTDLSKDRIINIDEFVPPHLYVSTYNYPVGIIYPKPGKEDKVYNLFKNASSHIQVYWRKDVPEKYHYSDNVNRISPIVTIVELGWIVNSSHYFTKLKGGNHGYFQGEDDMKATLLAMGPSFKKGFIKTSNLVDLYSLMMHLIGLKANPNNGSFSSISSILNDNSQTFIPRTSRWKYDKFILVIIWFLLVQIVGCGFLVIRWINISSFLYPLFLEIRRKINIKKNWFYKKIDIAI